MSLLKNKDDYSKESNTLYRIEIERPAGQTNPELILTKYDQNLWVQQQIYLPFLVVEDIIKNFETWKSNWYKRQDYPTGKTIRG